jgi:hypothetical protein
MRLILVISLAVSLLGLAGPPVYARTPLTVTALNPSNAMVELLEAEAESSIVSTYVKFSLKNNLDVDLSEVQVRVMIRNENDRLMGSDKGSVFQDIKPKTTASGLIILDKALPEKATLRLMISKFISPGGVWTADPSRLDQALKTGAARFRDAVPYKFVPHLVLSQSDKDQLFDRSLLDIANDKKKRENIFDGPIILPAEEEAPPVPLSKSKIRRLTRSELLDMADAKGIAWYVAKRTYHVEGDTVVEGLLVRKTMPRKQLIVVSGAYRIFHVFIKQNGKWKLKDSGRYSVC